MFAFFNLRSNWPSAHTKPDVVFGKGKRIDLPCGSTAVNSMNILPIFYAWNIGIVSNLEVSCSQYTGFAEVCPVLLFSVTKGQFHDHFKIT